MNGKLRLALVTGAAAILGALSIPGAALAVTTTTHTHVVSSPDDTVGSGPWARDTFERTTTVKSTKTGFKIQISDSGTFVTADGKVKGTVTGQGTFIVTGGTYNSDHGMSTTVDRSSVAVKDSFTGQWWKNFVDGGASAGIDPWNWAYKSVCWNPAFVEVHTESSTNGSAGDRPSKVCPPKPTPTATATVKPTPTKTHPTGKPTWTHKPTATPTSTVTVTPTATKTATATPTPTTAGPTAPATITEETPGPGGLTGNDTDLPKTGPSLGLLIGGALILSGLGGGLWYATRRRKVEFTA